MYRWLFLIILPLTFSVKAQKDFTDTLVTTQGDLVIHVLGHASVWLEFKGISVYVDPYTRIQDFTGMNDADLILVTHAHKDHFDTLAINMLLKQTTRIIYTAACAGLRSYSGMDTILANGDSATFLDLPVTAVPAYNIEKTQHLKGVGNGYLIRFGNERIYLSGDTEKIPEMDSFPPINLAFLPLSQPYGMTPEMMAETVLLLTPEVLVPYHYDDSDVTPLLDLLKDIPNLEVWTGEPASSGYPGLHIAAEIMLQPNPARDRLFIGEAGPYSATVYDMAGSVVLSCPVGNEGVLDIGELDKGQYLLVVKTGNTILSGRFVKN